MGLFPPSPDGDRRFAPVMCKRGELASDRFTWWAVLGEFTACPLKEIYKNVATLRLIWSDTRPFGPFFSIWWILLGRIHFVPVKL